MEDPKPLAPRKSHGSNLKIELPETLRRRLKAEAEKEMRKMSNMAAVLIREALNTRNVKGPAISNETTCEDIEDYRS